MVAPETALLPPSTNGCVTRAEMKIVGIACCVGVENVWAAVRTFHAFCGIPSLRFFNLSMGE